MSPIEKLYVGSKLECYSFDTILKQPFPNFIMQILKTNSMIVPEIKTQEESVPGKSVESWYNFETLQDFQESNEFLHINGIRSILEKSWSVSKLYQISTDLSGTDCSWALVPGPISGRQSSS